MDTYKVKWTILEQRVFALLAKHAGEKLSQRDIAKKLSVSPTAVGSSVSGLKQLITKEKTKTINFISFNRDNEQAVHLKRIENIKSIYTSGFVAYLQQELSGSTIILFGSYSRGEDTKESDIDIAIIERKAKTLSRESYEKILQRNISTQFFSSWKDIPHNLRNNILNGIVLHGSVNL